MASTKRSVVAWDEVHSSVVGIQIQGLKEQLRAEFYADSKISQPSPIQTVKFRVFQRAKRAVHLVKELRGFYLEDWAAMGNGTDEEFFKLLYANGIVPVLDEYIEDCKEYLNHQDPYVCILNQDELQGLIALGLRRPIQTDEMTQSLIDRLKAMGTETLEITVLDEEMITQYRGAMREQLISNFEREIARVRNAVERWCKLEAAKVLRSGARETLTPPRSPSKVERKTFEASNKKMEVAMEKTKAVNDIKSLAKEGALSVDAGLLATAHGSTRKTIMQGTKEPYCKLRHAGPRGCEIVMQDALWLLNGAPNREQPKGNGQEK